MHTIWCFNWSVNSPGSFQTNSMSISIHSVIWGKHIHTNVSAFCVLNDERCLDADGVHIQPDFLRCDSLYCAFHFRLIVFGSVLSFLLNMFYCVSAYVRYIYIYFLQFFFLGMECRVKRRTTYKRMAYVAFVCVLCFAVHEFCTRSIWTCNMFGTSIRSRAREPYAIHNRQQRRLWRLRRRRRQCR